jgi:hypothetical protein
MSNIIRQLLAPLDASGSVLPAVLDEVGDVAELARVIVENCADDLAEDSTLRAALGTMLARMQARAELAAKLASKATHRVLLDDAIEGAS